MKGARKPGAISMIVPRTHTGPFEVETARCPGSGACEVCKCSRQFICQCTIAATSKGTSAPEQGSNRNETPRFASGATLPSPGAFWFADNGDRFACVLQHPPTSLSAPRQQLGQPKSCKERLIRINALSSDAQPAFQLERPHSMSTLARGSRVKARG
jgi:hypothetical protein